MKLKIYNDPFQVVLRAFEELYPDKYAVIHYDHELDYEKNEFGYTEFPDNDGEYPVIGINPKLTVQDAVEILAHELAHLAAGIDAGHGEKWKEAFDKIHEKYNELFKKMIEAPLGLNCEVIGSGN